MQESSALDIQDLVFAYQGSDWQLSLASLNLNDADQMLLSAGSGHGKSTLLQLICGLLDPTSGKVLVAGQDIHALRGHKRDLFRGGHIGMIFQTFNLLHGFSAVENVMAAMMFSDIPRREHQPRAMELLAHLGIERPHADPDKLSVGQQQRVAVARALVCDPELVLADEPTASLDPENASVAIELIQNACRQKGAALLCTSHDPAVAERFENRAVIDDLAIASAPT